MRSILALGVLFAIVASAGNGAAALIVIEQLGSSASTAVGATVEAVDQVAGDRADQELGLAFDIVDNQVYVVNYVVGNAQGRANGAAALPLSIVSQAWADANFAAQTELAVLMASMEYERAVALCLGHPDPVGAALCAQAVTFAWMNGIVEA